jgi:Flp pilus assembly protein TadD
VTEAEALAALRGPDPVRAAQAESALWAMWCRSDSPDLETRLAEAIAAMERRDFAGAEASLTSLIAVAPAWAEAWNKRATVRYLAGDYPGSIARPTTSARSPARGSATWPWNSSGPRR